MNLSGVLASVKVTPVSSAPRRHPCMADGVRADGLGRSPDALISA